MFLVVEFEDKFEIFDNEADAIARFKALVAECEACFTNPQWHYAEQTNERVKNRIALCKVLTVAHIEASGNMTIESVQT